MKNRDKIDKSNIIAVQGGKHVTYDGLLDLAHREGLLTLESRLVQAPDAGNNMTAICEASATFRRGELVQTFADIGDANPGNTSKGIAPHLIRMASTRAKGRVLRDALNIDGCSAEELTDYTPNLHEDGAPKAATKPAPAAKLSLTQTQDAIKAEAIRGGWTPEKLLAHVKATYQADRVSKLALTTATQLLDELKLIPDAEAAYQAHAAAAFDALLQKAS